MNLQILSKISYLRLNEKKEKKKLPTKKAFAKKKKKNDAKKIQSVFLQIFGFDISLLIFKELRFLFLAWESFAC